MITIVVAYVHLPATRCAPSFPMYLKGCIVYDVTFHSYLPERFVELVNGNSALVETSPRHNCIVAPKSALLRQAREMVVKAHIIFNKWLKVIPKKRHVYWFNTRRIVGQNGALGRYISNGLPNLLKYPINTLKH